MSRIAQAVAEVLGAAGPFAVVTGRGWDGAQPLVDAGATHVVAPGPSTRLAVAAGFALGGQRAYAVIDAVAPGQVPPAPLVALTTSAACAAQALSTGWTVVQPWAAADVEPLLAAAADRPALVLLAGDTDLDDDDPPSARRSRLWIDGELGTLIGSGTAVPTMVRLASRLQQRGVDIAALEIALLDAPAQVPLVGGAALLVGGRDSLGPFRAERWPDLPTHAVELDGRGEADLIGAVLALVSVAR